MANTESPPGIFTRAYRRFVALRGTPREIALGFALGLFVGMSPYMMCHTVTAVFLASLLRWNKLSAAAGVFITNPVTAPFFYALTFNVGAALMPETAAHLSLPGEFSVAALMAVIRSGPEILWILTIGGVVTGIPIALAGFFAAERLIRAYRRRRLRRPRD
jgi:uncharacterized protein (DUF2062 family)